MTSSSQDKIAQVELLLKQGESKKALKLLEEIKGRKRLSKEDHLLCMLLESRIRMKLGELKNALSLVEKGLQAALKENNSLRAVESYATKAEIAWRLGELGMGQKAVEEGEKLIEGLEIDLAGEKARDLKRRNADLLCSGGVIHWYRGSLDRAIDYHHRSLDIMQELGDSFGMANVYNNLGLVYWSKSDLDRAVKYYKRSYAIYEEIGYSRSVAAVLNNLGNVYCMKGDLDDALEVYQRSLAIKTELDSRVDIGTTLINIGSVYQMKGEIDLALDYYQRSLAISEEMDAKSNIALAFNNLGDIHMLRGELGQALEHFEKCLGLYKELGVKQDIALSLSNLGEVYRKKGEPEQALEYYQQSLSIYEEMENDPYAALLLFNLLWIALEREDSSAAQQYLEKLERVNERTENKIIDQRYRIARALWLNSSKRARHRAEAIRMLEEVIGEGVKEHSLAITAMIHLCDMLLAELKLTGEEEVFDEIKELTDQLLGISKKQSSHWLLAETYLLQSKLALIELDMGQAKKLLKQAQSIAEEKGLSRLSRIVAEESDSLLSHLKKWESLIQQEPSKQKMIDMTHIDAFLEQMIQKTVTSVMEQTGITTTEMPKKRYKIVYLDRFKDPSKAEKIRFRVGIAQIGLSKAGDIIHEFYEERVPGLFGFREEIVETVRSKVRSLVEDAATKEVNLLIFPELTIDLSCEQIREDIMSFAKTYDMYLIPGSYHDQETKQNRCVIVSPEGVLWVQAKHIPAMIHFKGTTLTEGIVGLTSPKETVICSTEYGRIAVVICRDFLDMDLRVELKNAEPPVDLIINPAFTPVTADFKAAHFDARRSIYAYCFFANVAEFGDSLIYTPEKERIETNVPARSEGLIYKEVDLFKLRSERKKWEIEQAKNRPFIQSTR
jgi:tetratricopeptide (TPR) repeat protein/predicted amidohydrolase